MKKQYQTSDFDYSLPPELIAQHPLPERTQSRLLVVSRKANTLTHHAFAQVIDYLAPGDVLVLNNTKVFPARFYGRKATGGRIECLFERLLPKQRVLAHIRSSHAPKVGTVIYLGGDDTAAEVVDRHPGGLFELVFEPGIDLLMFAAQHGEVPLPPYITRTPDALDEARYQTVFAQHPGAVAAPTAGLHFDEALLQRVREKGVLIEQLTLHVGAGTFQPVRVEDLSAHTMHSEYIEVSPALCDTVARVRARGGRVIAVGTTVVRALESAAQSGVLQPFQGETDIFISPGYAFRCVDALITNFHLPKSTLLMLVCAFAGYDIIMQAYRTAIDAQYRFFSYGDAMLIE